jgi:hypothetical protein
MKKLMLDLEAVRVESFETEERARAIGTVHGWMDDSPMASCVDSCDDTICYSCDTCRKPCRTQVCDTSETTCETQVEEGVA